MRRSNLTEIKTMRKKNWQQFVTESDCFNIVCCVQIKQMRSAYLCECVCLSEGLNHLGWFWIHHLQYASKMYRNANSPHKAFCVSNDTNHSKSCTFRTISPIRRFHRASSKHEIIHDTFQQNYVSPNCVAFLFIEYIFWHWNWWYFGKYGNCLNSVLGNSLFFFFK